MLFRSRSGKRSLLLLSSPCSSIASRATVHFFAYAAFFGAVGSGLWHGLPPLLSTLEPSHPVQALGRPVSAREQSRGVIRTQAHLVPTTGWAAAASLCLVVHEYYRSGKNSGWREDWRTVNQPDWDIATSDGRRFAFTTSAFAFEPELLQHTEPSRQVQWARFRNSREGRFREQCLQPGQPFFVDGCEADGAIVPCGPMGTVVLTPGAEGPQRRIDLLAASAANKLAVTGGAGLLLLLWASLIGRAALAPALIERFAKRASMAWWGLGTFSVMLPVIVGASLWLSWCAAEPGSDLSISRAGHFWATLALAAYAIAFIVFLHKRRSLGEAMQPILSLPTIPLSKAEGELVEVHARVHPRAPVAAGPLSQQPRAWWKLLVHETVTVGKNTSTHQVLSESSGETVPILDETAEGALELTHARLDIPTVGMRFSQGDYAAEAARLRGRLHPSPGHKSFTAEEQYLEPTQELYILGHVARIRDPKGQATYRSQSTAPLVKGGPDAALFVHAGSERSILGGLKAERAVATLILGATGAAFALLATFEVWLLSR